MGYSAASYKMVYGLGDHLSGEITERLKDGFYSLNIDEATAENSTRVLTILISFFDAELGRVVVHHLSSEEMVVVNSKNVTNLILKVLREKKLNGDKLLAVLMDSCNVMRGSKTGVETRLRQEFPNLMDIDGDSCHHANNAAK